MNKNYPSISVVIPVKNEAVKIKSCIEGILSQSVPVAEVIVVDSGSTDGTLEILRGYEKVKVYSIPPDSFNHGETRNFGVSKAASEFVLLTVGDARAYDQFWIQHLLEGFDSPDVAGVCGQQVVPHDRDKNPIDWFRPVDQPSKRKYQFKKEEFESISPQQRKEACGWDDVTAMYRKEVLLKIPFRRATFCEDAIWASDALIEGYALVYNNAAKVYHYHLVNPDFTFKQSLSNMYFKYKYIGYTYPSPALSLKQKLSIVKTLLTSKDITYKEKWHWFKYNLDQEKALIQAHSVFLNALNTSEKKLDEVHEMHCGKPPIPLKVRASERLSMQDS